MSFADVEFLAAKVKHGREEVACGAVCEGIGKATGYFFIEGCGGFFDGDV